ncbi:hypothetical protein PF005_g18674 [Phytophthora fragariae]|uniref:Uncharacterized protein n=1 Tax=Phytophthora fragariae TaxID=53985 RepID=A0A6A3E9F8_9STRA|nr:hypothetical protein PF009_g19591 [Phytophthora fragariae]KAE9121187.1 hypothetical protein PF006_g17959 [Phytophthora fragariae]KAE9191874.1 hypothetical protein PF005_g18674 [Phytophthora fragariae]KAE9206707.1 hypothetical protein PF002_g19919 [Phytophthora fragariae]KAE9326088.1 hypothetical protein PF008_g16731 [Phytophthora fragariae]
MKRPSRLAGIASTFATDQCAAMPLRIGTSISRAITRSTSFASMSSTPSRRHRMSPRSSTSPPPLRCCARIARAHCGIYRSCFQQQSAPRAWAA